MKSTRCRLGLFIFGILIAVGLHLSCGNNSRPNQCPAAVIDGDSLRHGSINRPIDLDSTSTDADNGPKDLSYQWIVTQRPVENAVIVFSAAAAQHTTFSADTAGTYAVELHVYDGDAPCQDKPGAVAGVQLELREPPAVTASEDLEVAHTYADGKYCAQASLSATATDPANGTLTYQWDVAQYPNDIAQNGADVTFEIGDALNTIVNICWDPAAHADLDPVNYLGNYTLRVTATNREADQGSDFVIVNVTNGSGPTPREPIHQSMGRVQFGYVAEGQCEVVLNIAGISIVDPDGDPLVFTWTWPDNTLFVFNPQGTYQNRLSPNTSLSARFACKDFNYPNVNDSFIFDGNSSFNIVLTAMDAFGWYASAAEQAFGVADTLFSIGPIPNQIGYNCTLHRLSLPVFIEDPNHNPVKLHLRKLRRILIAEQYYENLDWTVICQQGADGYTCEAGTTQCQDVRDYNLMSCSTPCDLGVRCPLQSGDIEIWAEDPWGQTHPGASFPVTVSLSTFCLQQ